MFLKKRKEKIRFLRTFLMVSVYSFLKRNYHEKVLQKSYKMVFLHDRNETIYVENH